MKMTKRIFDIVLSSSLLMMALPLCFLVSIIIKLSSPGPILHWSNRIGVGNRAFLMPKFRSMIVGTPEISSERLKSPEKYLTLTGKILRMTSFDEVPQFFSVLIGDMSLVGPRPALSNQVSLIKKRTELGISNISPGITGLAQVKARDNLNDVEKIALDLEYLKKMSLLLDVKILFLTIGVCFRKSKHKSKL